MHSTADQWDRDLEHLRILSILYYVFGGLSTLCGCFPLIYVFMGILMISAPSAMGDAKPQDAQMMAMTGGVMALFGVVAAVLIWVLGGLVAWTGWCLSRQRYYTLCLVVSALVCLNMPLGTILGVFTIIVLLRPTVKERFEQTQAAGS